MQTKTPLTGHTSPDTAYVVADYPYGFKLRTTIRYWLESHPKRGFRFVSQTVNPKTGAWNKPKCSTYTEISASLYLDEKGHVQWTGIGQYSNPATVLEFVRTFPHADLSRLAEVAKLNTVYARGMQTGAVVWTINGVPQPPTEGDKERYAADIEAWQAVTEALQSCRVHSDCLETPELGSACAAASV